MPQEIASTEMLSRFIFDRSMVRSDNTLRHTAFWPNRNRKTSVFCVSGFSDDAIWAIGLNLRPVPLHGRGDIIASRVLEKGLRVIPSPPPERHADIIDWPDERSKMRLIAQELAEEARFYVAPHQAPF